MIRSRCIALAAVLIATLSATSLLRAQDVRRAVHVAAGEAAVASESAAASLVGRRVLEEGGNAVDAAVAVALSLAVTWPEAGNLGGGGFMMVLPAPGMAGSQQAGEQGGKQAPAVRAQPVCVEYRERAPRAATATMFDRDDSKHSWKIVGVPGTVRGLQLAHKTYGRLPWRRVAQPAAELAKGGFEVDSHLAASINSVLRQTAQQADEFAPLRAAYGRQDGKPWQAGDRLVLPALGNTLEAIARDPDAFYEGPLAQKLADAMAAGDGLITTADLHDYRANVRAPIHGVFRGYDVWGPPPPSSGGICLIEALNILENFPLAARPVYAEQNVHLRAETMRRVFADRARHLGDPDFVSIPPHLTTKDYAKQLAREIDARRATPSAEVAADIALAPESDHTTHFSVVDRDGMAVSNTYTLEASWGSRRLVPELGYVLNNEMGDFNWLPGVTDRQGRIGTPPNLIEPGKRMLSSQTPTLVTKQGRFAYAVGSPGGRTIINTVLGILVDVLEHGRSLPEAVAAPRMHHQWFPDELSFEGANDPKYAHLKAALTERGHRVASRRQGSAHCIAALPNGEVLGVADFRRGGSAEAVPRKP
ncbi:MAG: gamma-glutamyltransferase [Planctomycetales bacterium]|nr:gamma-glutamyltransferase [Planctomycetales bacterium]